MNEKMNNIKTWYVFFYPLKSFFPSMTENEPKSSHVI